MHSRNVRYLPAVDHLRLFAAVLIVLYHGWHDLFEKFARADGSLPGGWPRSHNPLWTLLLEGHTAVALFMVLSGFIFTYGAFGREVRYGAFLKNRLLRIYPLFVVVLATAVCVAPGGFSVTGLLQTLLGLGSFPGGVSQFPFTPPVWAVAVECQFYLMFPFLVRFFHERGVRWVLGLMGCALLLRLAGSVHGANPRDLAYFTILGRIDQFLIGMLVARWYLERPAPPRAPGLRFGLAAALVAGLLWWYNAHGGFVAIKRWQVLWVTAEGLGWGLFVLAYLDLAPRLSARLSGLLARLGEVSFSLYLLHFPLHCSLVKIGCYRSCGLPPNLDALVNAALLLVPAALGLSFLTYHVIEKPFLSLRVRYLAERDAAPGAGATVPLPRRYRAELEPEAPVALPAASAGV